MKHILWMGLGLLIPFGCMAQKPQKNTGDPLKKGNFSTFSFEKYQKDKADRKAAESAEFYEKDFTDRIKKADSVLQYGGTSALYPHAYEYHMYMEMTGDTVTKLDIMVPESQEGHEKEYAENKIKTLGLKNIAALAAKSKDVTYSVFRIVTMDIEPLPGDNVMKMQKQTGNDRKLFNRNLLTYIHNMLAENKEKLGITDPEYYEHQFEPANLSTEDQIKNRIKFINYVYATLNP